MQQGQALRALRAELSSVQFDASEPSLLEKLKARRNPAPLVTTEKHMPEPKLRRFAGLEILVENPKGSIRSGVSKSGKRWAVKMQADYGYLKKANGEDGEGLDIFIGPDQHAPNIYVVHQNQPDTGRYDEDKLVVGVHSSAEAKALYLSNYDTPKFFRSVTEIPLSTFKKMLTKAEPGSVHWKRKMSRGLDTSAMFSDFTDGDWITVGGAPDGKGQRHTGGTPVHVDEAGKINAGPPSLEGKKLAGSNPQPVHASGSQYVPPSPEQLKKPRIFLWHGTTLDAAHKIIAKGLKSGSRGRNASADVAHADQYPEDTGAEALVLLDCETKSLRADPNDQMGDTVAEGLFPDADSGETEDGFAWGYGSSCEVGQHKAVIAFDLTGAQPGYRKALQSGDFKLAEKLGVHRIS